MAVEKLPVNFKDDVIDTSVSDRRRYNIIDNEDGTKSLEDVTTYSQIGSNFGVEQVNQTNGAINELIDEKDATDEKIKEVQESVSTLQESLSDGKQKIKSAEEADRLSTPRKINGMDFDGTKDIMIKDDTKLSLDKDFILLNQEELPFRNKVAEIRDSRITEDSLADVYFTSDTIDIAEEASITVDTIEGKCVLNAIKEPEGTVKASIHIRVV